MSETNQNREEIESRKQEAIAERVVAIIGPQSAARLALNELKRKRDTGQEAWLLYNGKTWLVATRKLP